VRAGVGRPDSSDPEVVSSYVLSRFREPRDQLAELVERAAGEAERLIQRIAADEQASRPRTNPGSAGTTGRSRSLGRGGDRP
jgi:peptidyl-tRNA hydrolase